MTEPKLYTRRISHPSEMVKRELEANRVAREMLDGAKKLKTTTLCVLTPLLVAGFFGLTAYSKAPKITVQNVIPEVKNGVATIRVETPKGVHDYPCTETPQISPNRTTAYENVCLTKGVDLGDGEKNNLFFVSSIPYVRAYPNDKPGHTSLQLTPANYKRLGFIARLKNGHLKPPTRS